MWRSPSAAFDLVGPGAEARLWRCPVGLAGSEDADSGLASASGKRSEDFSTQLPVSGSHRRSANSDGRFSVNDRA